MKVSVIALLLALNVILALRLYGKLRVPHEAEIPVREPLMHLEVPPQMQQKESSDQTATQVAPATTPFDAVYSTHPAAFAANLRRVGCPEETIEDILLAEMNRRYRAQEQALRPKPADHVPWGWSARTVEAKLLERRRQAAAIAREKRSLLLDALGHEVSVPIPLYATTVSDQNFEKMMKSLPEKFHQAAYQTHDQYWMRVEQLRARTKGFWEPADLQELEQLKRERAEALDHLRNAAK